YRAYNRGSIAEHSLIRTGNFGLLNFKGTYSFSINSLTP
ncbi:GSCOCG00002665001-RA-CDS, partial [Cotesia congregata]